MNEIQANIYIKKIRQTGQKENHLVTRVLHITEDDILTTAKILQAVELYMDETRKPISYRQERANNNNNHNPARKLKQTVSNPGQALDRYLAKQKNIAVKKTRVWARDHLARPAVAIALRIVGMDIKK